MADLLAGRHERGEAAGAVTIGGFYAQGGDLDRALDWWEIGVEERNPSMPYLGLPEFDPVRSSPRFAEFFREMNLPDEAIARYTNVGG